MRFFPNRKTSQNIVPANNSNIKVEFARSWVRFPAGLRCVFSSDPAVSSSIFVGAEREELIGNKIFGFLSGKKKGKRAGLPKKKAMAAKGALLELLENRSLAKDEKRKQVLACSRKHKMGVDSLLKFARDSMEVEEDELGALGTTVEEVTNSLVDVAMLEEDSRDTVCVPRSLLVNLSEKIDSLTMALNKQTEMIADVEVRLMKEFKTRESKIVDLIESSKVEPCSCSQSNGADTTNSKRIRKVKKRKNKKGRRS